MKKKNKTYKRNKIKYNINLNKKYGFKNCLCKTGFK